MNRGIVILICGLPGSGKSFFASRLRPKQTPSISAAIESGANYSLPAILEQVSRCNSIRARNKAAVYDEMQTRMRAALSGSESNSGPAAGPVILDANFNRADLRENFQKAAQAAGARFYIIQLVTDEDTARRRIQRPRPDSDADFAVYLKLRDAFEDPGDSCLKLRSSDTNIKRLLHRGIHYVYGEPLSGEAANDLEDLRRDPEFADAQNATADLIETHISWVLLGNDRVYKIKSRAIFVS